MSHNEIIKMYMRDFKDAGIKCSYKELRSICKDNLWNTLPIELTICDRFCGTNYCVKNLE